MLQIITTLCCNFYMTIIMKKVKNENEWQPGNDDKRLNVSKRLFPHTL
jgi:hypothetical protein